MSEGLGRVAVIGGGPAGVCAVKCCVDEGLVPTCYEQHDDIGMSEVCLIEKMIILYQTSCVPHFVCRFVML